MKKPTKRNKIIEGLKEAVEYAQQEKSAYDRIAERLVAATAEFNAALQEAHECEEMRVFLAQHAMAHGRAVYFISQIYRLTHTELLYEVEYQQAAAATKMKWQLVKDPSFKVATGRETSASPSEAAT